MTVFNVKAVSENMTSGRKMENALQEEVFHQCRWLRAEASMAESAYNRLLSKDRPSYSDKEQLYDIIQSADGLHDSVQILYNEINDLTDTVEDFEEVAEHLDQDFEDAYDAMDYLEEHQALGNPINAVFVEPLEIVKNDYSSLKMKIVSGPIYSDIKEKVQRGEIDRERRELQGDVDFTAEKLGFADSKLEELIKKSNDSNMEAAKPLLEEQASRTFQHYKYGIGTLRDVHQYRQEHGLLDQGNYVNLFNQDFSKNSETLSEEARDIDTEPLDRAMSESTDTLTDISKLPLEEGVWEKLDDSEIVDDASIVD